MKITELQPNKKYFRESWRDISEDTGSECYITIRSIDSAINFTLDEDRFTLEDFQADDWEEILEGQQLKDKKVKDVCVEIIRMDSSTVFGDLAREILRIID
jgi:hypothetical protein